MDINKELLKRIVSQIIRILVSFMLICIISKLFITDKWLEKSILFCIFWELGKFINKSNILYKNSLIQTKVDLMIVFLAIILFFTFIVCNLSDLSLVIIWVIIPFAFSLFL